MATLTIAVLISQLLSSTGELVTTSEVFAIEETRASIGGVWYPIAPEIKNLSELLEGIDATSLSILPMPFYAEVTFFYPPNSVNPYVKKIKKLEREPREAGEVNW